MVADEAGLEIGGQFDEAGKVFTSLCSLFSYLLMGYYLFGLSIVCLCELHLPSL